MASEITAAAAEEEEEEEEEEEDGNPLRIHDKEAERIRIRQIIDYQKSLYFYSSASSSFSSAAATTCSSSLFTSPRKSSSLLDLMKEGSTSLGRLFNMEHTSLGNYLTDYSVSPIIKPILLWGSDSDNDNHDDPWAGMKQMGIAFESRIDGQVVGESIMKDQDFMQKGRRNERRKRKLIRTVSYKRLPRFGFWRCVAFRFRLKFVKRLRIMIGGRKF